MELNDEKESVYNLMRTGAISEVMWNDFKQAEADLQLELFDVQAEAETFKKDWSQSILKEAAMLLHKEREMNEIKKMKEIEEKKVKEMDKKAQKAKEHEERMTEEQEEKANRVRERLMAEAQAAISKKTKAK
jgi:translocation protein SEC66